VPRSFNSNFIFKLPAKTGLGTKLGFRSLNKKIGSNITTISDKIKQNPYRNFSHKSLGWNSLLCEMPSAIYFE